MARRRPRRVAGGAARILTVTHAIARTKEPESRRARASIAPARRRVGRSSAYQPVAKVPAVGEIDLEFVSTGHGSEKPRGGADARLQRQGRSRQARQDARRAAAKRDRDCLRAIGTRRQRDAYQLAGQVQGRARLRARDPAARRRQGPGHPLAPDREQPRRRSRLEVERDRVAEDERERPSTRSRHRCRQIDEQLRRCTRRLAAGSTRRCRHARSRRSAAAMSMDRQRGIVREAKEGYRSRQADGPSRPREYAARGASRQGIGAYSTVRGFTTGSPNTSALKR